MKKISVIVPVYNVEDYLERCLHSLVKQTIEDIEIILINDGSPDNSQKIINCFKEQYPDKIVSVEIENSGVARARNIGLQYATGEYVGFVDSDDYVDVSMFEKLYEKAQEDEADIVASGYTRLWSASSKDFQLGETEIYGKSLKESPMILVSGVPYIWNKIFSRSMINENKISFNEFGIFEDLLFSYQCYLYANCISKCDKPLYYYRVRREGSATNRFSEKFFDIFRVMDLLIQNCKDQGIYEILKEELEYTALNHIIIRWETEVLPEEVELKKRFFKKSLAYLSKTFPGYQRDKLYFERYPDKDPKEYFSRKYWKKRFKKDIIHVSRQQNISERVKKKIANGISRKKKELMNSFAANPGSKYLEFVKQMPINEKWILFDSQHGADFNGNMFYLLKEVYYNFKFSDFEYYIPVSEERIEEFKEKLYFYGMTDVKFVMYESTEHLKALAAAKYLFTDTSMPVYFIKREQQMYLNTWHGTPFKTLGRSSHGEMHRIGNLQRNFRIADYILYPSDYMKEHMLEDYMIDNVGMNKILLTGYPRNTVFFEEPNKNIIKAEHLEGKQVVAYLPTWRGNLKDVSGEDKILTYLRQIDSSLKENQVCYVNLHPYLKGSIDFSQFENLRTIPLKYETYDFLNCCDVLITDYSSVFFDYACTKKKIILFAYDEEEYFRDRGVYFGFEKLPFTKVTNVEELMKAIEEPINYDDKEFLQKFCPYEAGDVAEKICNQMILGEKSDLIVQEIPNNKKENVLVFVGNLKNNLIIDQLYNTLYEMDFVNQNIYLTFRARNVARNKCVLRMLPPNIKYIGQLGGATLSAKQEKIIYKYNHHSETYQKNKSQLDQIFIEEKKRLFDQTKIDKIIYYGAFDRTEMAVLGKFECKKYFYIATPKFKSIPISPLIFDMYDTIWVKDEGMKEYVDTMCDPGKVKILKCKEELFS